jgi:thioredoxin 1
MGALSQGYNDHYSDDAPQREEVDALTGLAVLEFGAPWCGHCQLAAPFVQKMFAERSEINHIKIYDGKGKRLGRSFAVKLWPTLIFLVNGVEVGRVVRPTSTAPLDNALRHSLS